MKRRLLSLFIVVATVITLISAFAVNAAADKKVTITYVWDYVIANKPVGNMEPTVGTGSARIAECTLTRPGYTFYCWSEKLDGSGKKYYADDVKNGVDLTEDTTLYAYWVQGNELPRVTIVYDGNGAYGAMAPTTAVAPVFSENTFQNRGKTFIGWTFTKDGMNAHVWKPGDRLEQPTGTYTVYAQWEDNEFQITYNANGGEGTMAPTVSTTPQVVNCTFTREGYTFAGWNTKADGSGSKIQVGAKFGTNVTLYAQWKAIDSSETTTTESVVETTTTESVVETTTTENVVETTTTESVVETTTTESVVETTTTESVVETTTTESVVETTTTEKVETTTTESVVETTSTVGSAPETTTTVVVDETTTTESVVETTTTDAVVDQTTTPQDNNTTTTEQNTDDENDGGFPVWIIIVAVIAIGGGIVAFFVFKKK